ncbi:LOW QUALITY PROTEIN: uncharacterized protein LOC110012128 [Sesamum indicum]|uniref:LOW QUALITY PROTEIN: uncharacterized protein LOC110012128 n=1 Tax=Sesamum indicum TaxID=4182 RepID=A0A8M8V1P1_SESIN|nr:LOW QUALITY PROTEIN: uncharacterized protein LOC110012128 [Sesamum indicum]
MDLDRPHFRTTSTGSSSTTTAAATTSELFICFASRLSSSSSMKLSKSILSPGRAARDTGPVSLSSSLSRRLRTNGSLKGGASPFFTTTGKKRGCAFENPEPSSPKVTCIGQVRVKTKKKVKQSRSLSKRRSGEVSFRKIEQACGDGGHQSEDKVCPQQQRYSNASAHYQQQQQPQECLPHRNQRWVHLPISICEALRSFGAEFSCLFPCKSSCFSTGEGEKAEKQNGTTRNENGCGAVFARWLVSVNDGEGGKRREIELVVGGGDEEERGERMSMRSSRRHVFEDIEVKDDRIEVKGQSVGGEEEAARVSICIPPKNALLLMRCRSDPMKMATLANRFSWDADAAPRNENEDIEEEENEVSEEEVEVQPCEGSKDEVFEQEVDISVEANEEQETPAEANLEMEVGDLGHGEETQEEEVVVISTDDMVGGKEQEELQQEILGNEEEAVVESEEEEEEEEEEKEEVESNMSSFEALLDQENVEHYEDCPIEDEEEVEDSSVCHLSPSTESDEEDTESNEVQPLLEEVATDEEKQATEESYTADKGTTFVNNEEVNQLTAQLQSEPETTHQEEEEEEEEDDEEEEEEEEEEELQTAIPPTELETENPANQELVISNEEPKKEKESPVLPECLLLMMCEPKLSMEVSKETWVCSTDFIRWLPERPRKQTKATKAGGCDHEPVKRRLSIDSKPKPIAPPPPAEHEPFVLTRCKSEPMRTAAAKLMPESCFWKNAIRKLEPHRRATLGVGAAGVGF